MKSCYDDPNYGDEFRTNTSLISVCCGAHPLGEVCDDIDGKYVIGICSFCHEHTTFEQEIEAE